MLKYFLLSKYLTVDFNRLLLQNDCTPPQMLTSLGQLGTPLPQSKLGSSLMTWLFSKTIPFSEMLRFLVGLSNTILNSPLQSKQLQVIVLLTLISPLSDSIVLFSSTSYRELMAATMLCFMVVWFLRLFIISNNISLSFWEQGLTLLTGKLLVKVMFWYSQSYQSGWLFQSNWMTLVNPIGSLSTAPSAVPCTDEPSCLFSHVKLQVSLSTLPQTLRWFSEMNLAVSFELIMQNSSVRFQIVYVLPTRGLYVMLSTLIQFLIAVKVLLRSDCLPRAKDERYVIVLAGQSTWVLWIQTKIQRDKRRNLTINLRYNYEVWIYNHSQHTTNMMQTGPRSHKLLDQQLQADLVEQAWKTIRQSYTSHKQRTTTPAQQAQIAQLFRKKIYDIIQPKLDCIAQMKDKALSMTQPQAKQLNSAYCSLKALLAEGELIKLLDSDGISRLKMQQENLKVYLVGVAGRLVSRGRSNIKCLMYFDRLNQSLGILTATIEALRNLGSVYIVQEEIQLKTKELDAFLQDFFQSRFVYVSEAYHQMDQRDSGQIAARVHNVATICIRLSQGTGLYQQLKEQIISESKRVLDKFVRVMLDKPQSLRIDPRLNRQQMEKGIKWLYQAYCSAILINGSDACQLKLQVSGMGSVQDLIQESIAQCFQLFNSTINALQKFTNLEQDILPLTLVQSSVSIIEIMRSVFRLHKKQQIDKAYSQIQSKLIAVGSRLSVDQKTYSSLIYQEGQAGLRNLCQEVRLRILLLRDMVQRCPETLRVLKWDADQSKVLVCKIAEVYEDLDGRLVRQQENFNRSEVVETIQRLNSLTLFDCILTQRQLSFSQLNLRYKQLKKSHDLEVQHRVKTLISSRRYAKVQAILDSLTGQLLETCQQCIDQRILGLINEVSQYKLDVILHSKFDIRFFTRLGEMIKISQIKRQHPQEDSLGKELLASIQASKQTIQNHISLKLNQAGELCQCYRLDAAEQVYSYTSKLDDVYKETIGSPGSPSGQSPVLKKIDQLRTKYCQKSELDWRFPVVYKTLMQDTDKLPQLRKLKDQLELAARNQVDCQIQKFQSGESTYSHIIKWSRNLPEVYKVELISRIQTMKPTLDLESKSNLDSKSDLESKHVSEHCSPPKPQSRVPKGIRKLQSQDQSLLGLGTSLKSFLLGVQQSLCGILQDCIVACKGRSASSGCESQLKQVVDQSSQQFIQSLLKNIKKVFSLINKKTVLPTSPGH